MLLLKNTLLAWLAFLAINIFSTVKADEPSSEVISLTKENFH
ncbi:1382_t:CDS:1, partial [Ambispora gerdemannii]